MLDEMFFTKETRNYFHKFTLQKRQETTFINSHHIEPRMKTGFQKTEGLE